MVIANAKYLGDEPPLPRCAADGDAMAAALRARGFDVVRRNDADTNSLDAAVGEFGRLVRSHPGCIAVWYFTGHGFETEKGDLSLAPVDGSVGVGGYPLPLGVLEDSLQPGLNLKLYRDVASKMAQVSGLI